MNINKSRNCLTINDINCSSSKYYLIVLMKYKIQKFLGFVIEEKN